MEHLVPNGLPRKDGAHLGTPNGASYGFFDARIAGKVVLPWGRERLAKAWQGAPPEQGVARSLDAQVRPRENR